MENATPKKLNIILKILTAIGNVLGKLRLKCHCCCESDCALNEEQKEIKRQKSREETQL